jgi:hypothetical protein
MTVIELSPFQAFREQYWNDDEFRRFQNYLIAHPLTGDVIADSGGLRKVRWSIAGSGKRGGARVIYFHVSAKGHLYLLFGYAKSRKDDLTPSQTKQLATLMKEVLHGQR